MKQIWDVKAVWNDRAGRMVMMMVQSGLKAARKACEHHLLAISFVLGVLGMFPTQSSAQSNTAVVLTTPGQITKMLSDWNNNAMLVALGPNVAFVNPAGCAATDYYETNPTDAATALNHSMLLTAYSSHASLALAIQGCSYNGRPHIISVSMPN